MKANEVDKIIFSPKDVDLSFSPIRNKLKLDSYVLGAFNPGLTRLPNKNLLLMVRVAESLCKPVKNNIFSAIRWTLNEGYMIDEIPIDDLDISDPRKYKLKNYSNKTYCLTSFSWLLPVELNEDGTQIVKIHYDKIIDPEEEYQEYGIEDARITKIDETYYMTACAVSSSRHSTILYTSNNGLDYNLLGVILDHQNKDMAIFPRKINELYYALTRPTGDHYFKTNISNENMPGPTINLSQSPDLLHWKPVEDFNIKLKQNSLVTSKNGGGATPIETDVGWLIIFHGVEQKGVVGIYRSFSCLLDKEHPYKIISTNYNHPILESNPSLTTDLNLNTYVSDIVFSTGIVQHNNKYIIASGELDLCCRLTHVDKKILIGNYN